MFKNRFTVVVAGLLACVSLVSYAHGAGGGSGSGAGSGKAGGGDFGGKSSQHISSEGTKNTNDPDSADRDKGLARADDRMSEESLAHEKADKAHVKNKLHKSSKLDTAQKD